jgi:hypothetical protein
MVGTVLLCITFHHNMDENQWNKRLSVQWTEYQPKNNLSPTAQLCGGVMANFVDYIKTGVKLDELTVEDIFKLCNLMEK